MLREALKDSCFKVDSMRSKDSISRTVKAVVYSAVQEQGRASSSQRLWRSSLQQDQQSTPDTTTYRSLVLTRTLDWDTTIYWLTAGRSNRMRRKWIVKEDSMNEGLKVLEVLLINKAPSSFLLSCWSWAWSAFNLHTWGNFPRGMSKDSIESSEGIRGRVLLVEWRWYK